MNTKRPNQVIFRLSDEELACLKEKIIKSGCRQQEYLRRVALEKEVLNTDGIKDIIPEMKKQGINLNQIAKQLNQRGYIDYDGTFSSVMMEVKDVWRSLRRYLVEHQ